MYVDIRLLLVLLLLHLPAAAGGQELCPRASAAMAAGSFSVAEVEARECLQGSPGDRSVRLLLARCLGFQGKYEEALAELGEVRALWPEDLEGLVLYGRVLHWKGESERAYRVLRALAPEQVDWETAMLLGQLALVGDSASVAEPWYWAALARGAPRAMVLLAVARLGGVGTEEGRALLREACGEGGEGSGEACRELERVEEGRREGGLEGRWFVGIQPGYMAVLERPDAWSAMLFGGWKVDKVWQLGLSADLRSRDYGEGMKRDLFMLGTAAWKGGEGWGVDGGLGGTAMRVFSPTLSVYVEPWYKFSKNIVGSLKLWHLQFGGTPVEVVSPHLDLYFWRMMLDIRYYLSVSDGALGHAVTGKLHFFADPIRVWGGGGTGNKADYLDSLERGSGFFWFGTIGAGFRLPTRTHLGLDYIYRDESVGEQTYKYHNILFTLYQWF